MFKSHFFVIISALITLSTQSAFAKDPPDPLNDQIDRQRENIYRSCKEILVPPTLTDATARSTTRSSLVTARVSYTFSTIRTLRATYGNATRSTTGYYPSHRYEETPIHFRIPTRLVKTILKYTHKVRIIGERRAEDEDTTPIELNPQGTIPPGEIAPFVLAASELVERLQEHSVILSDVKSRAIKPGYSNQEQHHTTQPVISLRVTDPSDPAITYLLLIKWVDLLDFLP